MSVQAQPPTIKARESENLYRQMRNKLLNCFCNVNNLLWDFPLPVPGSHDSTALRKTKSLLLSKPSDTQFSRSADYRLSCPGKNVWDPTAFWKSWHSFKISCSYFTQTTWIWPKKKQTQHLYSVKTVQSHLVWPFCPFVLFCPIYLVMWKLSTQDWS